MPHQCCVVGCNNSSIKEECKIKGIRFFCFPTPDTKQRELWVRAVKRHPWQLQKEHPTRTVCPLADSVASEDERHDLVGVETDDVKEIGVQTDIAYTSLCEESAIERFPSISPDTILKQCS